jgi:hypothetical protein
MLRYKSKTRFVNQEPNTQNAIARSFKLFKAHCATTIIAKNASFHKNIFKAQIKQAQLFKIKSLILR